MPQNHMTSALCVSLLCSSLLTSCKLLSGNDQLDGSPQRQSSVNGNVVSGALIGTKIQPLSLLCQRRENLGTNKSYDLTLHRQLDGSYHAFLKNPVLANRKKQLYVVETGLYAYDNWDIDFRHYVLFERRLPSSILGFNVFYYRQWENPDYNATIIIGYWKKEDLDGDYEEKLFCQEESRLALQSPKPGEKLTVVGTIYDKILKTNIQVAHSIELDALIQDGGKEKMISLTNSYSPNQIPLKAPVYNKNQELVGYVSGHNPKHLAGILIDSVHDTTLGNKIRSVTGQNSWNPSPPTQRAPSPRFTDLICHGILNSNAKSIDPDDEYLNKTCGKFKDRIEVY